MEKKNNYYNQAVVQIRTSDSDKKVREQKISFTDDIFNRNES